MPDDLIIREINAMDDFDMLQRPWNHLVDQLSVPSPFQTWEWNRIWWRHFGQGRLRILLFMRGDDPVGIAPFHSRRFGLGPLGAGLLVPLGWEDLRSGSQLTEQWELLFPADRRLELFSALAGWLQRSGWSAAILPGLLENENLPEWVATRVVRRRVFTLPYRGLPHNPDEFISGLNKKMRDNVRYYRHLLERHGHVVSYVVASDSREVEANVNILFDLHRARAHARMSVEHGDKFRSSRRRAFMRDVAETFSAVGQLRVGVLRVGPEPVAAQLWMERGHTLFLLHTGYRPAWASYSVAMLATLEAMKDGMARGMNRVEFLRGAGQFKNRWDLMRRSLSQILVVRRPALWKPLVALRQLRSTGTVAIPGLVTAGLCGSNGCVG